MACNADTAALQVGGPLTLVPCCTGPITYLHLGYNAFSGVLPAAWVETMSPLTQLSYFGVHNNRLSGTLPPSWLAPGTWPNLTTGAVWGNPSLCGDTPPLTGWGRTCVDTTQTRIGTVLVGVGFPACGRWLRATAGPPRCAHLQHPVD
jgi:hypothetical protein